MTNPPNNQTSEPLEMGLAGIRIPAIPENARQQVADERKKTTETLPLLGLPNDREFQQLRISALLKDRCYVTEKGLVRIQLELSEHPPLGWSYIFLNVWRKREERNKARVGIEEDTLWWSARRLNSRTTIFLTFKRQLKKRTRVFGKRWRSKSRLGRSGNNWIEKHWKRSWAWSST